MTRTKLHWPQRPRRTIDPSFGRRLTWRCETDAYEISCIPEYLPGEFCLVYPAWSGNMPTRHRTLKAAQRAAEDHRNEVSE